MSNPPLPTGNTRWHQNVQLYVERVRGALDNLTRLRREMNHYRQERNTALQELRALGGLSLAEIAQLTGIPLRSVNHHLHQETNNE